MAMKLDILYEDNHLLAVCKPGGLLVQGDRTNDPTLLGCAKEYLKEKYHKPGQVFLGLVHRIDRPVSGIVLFARTSKAASRVAKAFKDREVGKVYAAVVEGMPELEEGILEDLVARHGRRSHIVRSPDAGHAVPARLRYRVLAYTGGQSLLEVNLETGRHHQIRLQFSRRGHPVIGDMKYGAKAALPDNTIALHAWRLSIKHPVKDEMVVLSAPPPSRPPWAEFMEYFEE
jgi:23S rRNA pseudouridine1911/1915/1917 synthase